LFNMYLIVYLVPHRTYSLLNNWLDIPLHTRIRMALSDFFVNYWWAVFASPFAALFGLKFAMRTNPAVEYAVDHYKITMPLIGPILRKIILSRFASSFAMMYASGITVLDAIRSCGGIVGKRRLRAALHRAGPQIARGE